MKRLKKKNSPKPKPKNLSSPTSTGGAGVAFENRVQATRLLAMCLGLQVPGSSDGRIIELKFQARIHGHHTDDLVCLFELTDGQRARTLLQMKRSMVARANNQAFSEAVGAAWFDFDSPDFVKRRDSIFLIFGSASVPSMEGALTVCNWAKFSATSEEFLKKVMAADFSNAANRKAFSEMQAIVENHAGRKVDSSELQHFFRHLNFLGYDLDRDDTGEIANQLNLIQQAAYRLGENINPHDIWSRLVTSCITANGAAATVNFDNLEYLIGKPLNGLFAGARNHSSTPYSVTSLSSKPAETSPGSEAVYLELNRLSVLVESITKGSLYSPVDEQLPESRKDSVNKLVSGQLDGAFARIKALRYQDANSDLVSIGQSIQELDAHQKARWHLLCGICKWHMESPESAAQDFIWASELCKDEDKFVAAGVRGKILVGDFAGAVDDGVQALEQFPESLAVWQVVANARIALGHHIDINDVPPSLLNEADALQMVAWSRFQRGDKVGASDAIVQSLHANNPSFFTRDLALSIGLDSVAGDGVSAAFRVFDKNELEKLKLCADEFNPRGERLWKVQSPGLVSTAAANLAMAHLLLGQSSVSLTILGEARSHGIESPHFLRVELEAMAATGRKSDAVDIGKSKVNEMPKEALATFANLAGEIDDLDAISIALNASQQLEPEQPSLVASITAMKWSCLAKSDIEAAVISVKTAKSAAEQSVPELVAGAQILRSAGLHEEAEQRLELAILSLEASSESCDRLLVAQYLLSIRFFERAADVYAQIAPVGKYSRLHADLLYCYLRSGRRAKAKELIDSFPEGWMLDTDTRHMAMDLGQLAGDWELLSRLIPVEFEQAPKEVRSWLLMVMLAIRTSDEAVRSVLRDAPLALNGNTQELTQLATLELQYGQKEQALRRLYVERRRRLDSTEVAAAHVMAILAVTEDLPFMEDTLPVVTAGTSVALVDDEHKEQIFTLDPSGLPELPSTSEFLKAGSKESFIVEGLVLGATLSLPGTALKPRLLTVKRITSSYRRLFELSQMALRESLTPSAIAQVVSVQDEKTGEPDFSNVTRQLQKFNQQATKAIEVYSSSPITLGGLSKLLGKDVVDIVRGWRADGPSIQVSGGTTNEVTQGIENFKSGESPIVIDSVTLVELGSLECLEVLKIFGKTFVTSHSRDFLEAKLAEVQRERAFGTAYEENGQLGFVEVTAEQRLYEIEFYQSVVRCVREDCQVVAAYGIDSLASLTNQFEGVISAEEFSVLLVAGQYDATLVSLDSRLRLLGSQLGISGLSPQALLMHARDLGKLSETSYSLATFRQLAANRTFISVGSKDLAAIGYQGTEWLKFGLRKFVKHISLPETEFFSAFRVSISFLEQISQDGPCHFGAFCRILQVLSEGLFRRKDAPVDLEHLLFEGLCKVIPIRKMRDPRGDYIREVIQVGKDSAKKTTPSQLEDVSVLMCSCPPWIAFVPAQQSGTHDEASLQWTVDTTSKEGGDGEATSSSATPDTPFKLGKSV